MHTLQFHSELFYRKKFIVYKKMIDKFIKTRKDFTTSLMHFHAKQAKHSVLYFFEVYDERFLYYI